MAKDKKKEHKIHVARTRIKTSSVAIREVQGRHYLRTIRRITLAIIAVSIFAVILTLLAKHFNDPERIAKQKIEAAARNYYEHYYYDGIVKATDKNPDKKPEDVLARYANVGIDTITLRELTQFAEPEQAKGAAYALNYCNATETTVRIFPEEPYGRTNYRIEYNYNCNY